MFKTFLTNILYVTYIIIISYLIFNKTSIQFNINLTPTLGNSFMFFISNIQNFIMFYSNNIYLNYSLITNLSELIQLISLTKVYVLVTILTFIITITIVLNSMYFSNKIFILYNFLINL